MDGLRRASVNSFGFGGSNSHVVLDDAYNYLRLNGMEGKHQSVERPPRIETLAGHLGPLCSPRGCPSVRMVMVISLTAFYLMD